MISYSIFNGIYGKLADFGRKSPFSASAILGTITFIVFAVLYAYSPNINSADDIFFHFKLAYLIRTKGWNAVTNFDWIQISSYTKNHQRFDIELFHFFLIPFTYIRNMIVGVKLASIVLESLSLGLFYYVMRKIRIPQPLIFTLLAISTPVMFNLMLLGRNYLLVAPLLLLEMYLCVKEKRLALFWVVLFHVLWHRGTYLFPIAITLTVEMARRIENRRWNWKNIGIASSAVFLGSLFYPNSASDLWNIFSQVANLLINLQHQAGIANVVGTELKPMNFFQFCQDYPLFFLIQTACIALVLYFYQLSKGGNAEEMDPNQDETNLYMYALFILSVAFLGGMVLVSTRFLIFYIFFLLALLGVCFKNIISQNLWKKLGLKAKRYIFSTAMVSTAFLVCSVGLISFSNTNSNYLAFQDAAGWINKNSQDGEVVYLENWSFFPEMFFFDSRNKYVNGLEPTDMMKYDLKLFWKWYNISVNGYCCDRPEDCKSDLDQAYALYQRGQLDMDKYFMENAACMAKSIRNDFKSEFIVYNNNALLSQRIAFLDPGLVDSSFVTEEKGTVLKVIKLK